ncbi:MAG: hypothetical protein JNL53_14030 [Cyclobacteriaceae bacterium]|nr:hypothetical protein [Cyclobacteriaceae bacterium]
MLDFAGRFHPVLVHLPIGILLLAILFEWFPKEKKYKPFRRVLPITLLMGAFGAMVSVATGYLLFQSGDYEAELVGWHQWTGITLALVAFVYWFFKYEKLYKKFHRILSIIALLLVTVTGHLGGSITHGEDFLTAGFLQSASYDFSTLNLDSAKFYDDLIVPILEDKCYSCHGSAKQKGKLRLDSREHILKGGKGGVVLVAGRVEESELIDRIQLPREHEDHMPPKEKKQLTTEEIEILNAWIAAGANFTKTLAQGGAKDKVAAILSTSTKVSLKDVPTEPVNPASEEVLNRLRKWGVVVLPLAENSNYLNANLVNVTHLDSAIEKLSSLQEQLFWLKLSDQPLSDTQLAQIKSLKQITKLWLDNTAVTDAGLSNLSNFKNLSYLNLNGTRVSPAGLLQFQHLKSLRTIYLFRSSIIPEDVVLLKEKMPAVHFEIGNYRVPPLPSDTIILKTPAN